MSNSLKTIEVRAFVPAKDFELSKRFYQDFGFEMAWGDESLAYFRRGASVFLLQNFYEETYAANFMMHLLVEDADAWWRHIRDRNLPTKSWCPCLSARGSVFLGGGCAISCSSIPQAFYGGSDIPSDLKSQDGVSCIEKRSDFLLSTLCSYVEAIGGKLRRVAEFPDRKPVTISGLDTLAAHAKVSGKQKAADKSAPV